MKISFNLVTREHVLAACRKIIEQGVPTRRRGRSTFLRFEQRLLPAKFVLGLAYELASGNEADHGEYTGGEFTAKILRNLGFEIFHSPLKRASNVAGPELSSRLNKCAETSDHHKDVAPVKMLFLRELRALFGEVHREQKFDWLVVPREEGEPEETRKIRMALGGARGFMNFATGGHALRCDFFVPKYRLIIEVDERQHFSELRALALRNYPNDVQVGFDRDEWISECERTRAKDPNPPHRDEQRAYYDALRDLLAPRNGMRPVIRFSEEELGTTEGVQRAIHTLAQLVEPTARPSTLTGGTIKIITVCLRGENLKTQVENGKRTNLLETIANLLPAWDAETILFPGGFLFCPTEVGGLEHEQRKRVLDSQAFSETCRTVAAQSGRLIVAGVDGPNREQLCVAWNRHGILGLGRKIYPVEDEITAMTVHLEDFSSTDRLIALPGRKASALLCSCYDIFGCKPQKSNDARKISHDGQILAHGLRDAGECGRCEWRKLVRDATVALAAVHHFTRSGPGSGVGRFSTHGVNGASKYVGGGLVFAAAHFDRLPSAPDKSSLAAQKGQQLHPTTHLFLDANYRARERRTAMPDDTALIRFFEASALSPRVLM